MPPNVDDKTTHITFHQDRLIKTKHTWCTFSNEDQCIKKQNTFGERYEKYSDEQRCHTST